MSNNITKPVIGGSFLLKKQRNENLYAYHLRHPEMTHSGLAHIFKISRARVTQLLKRERRDGDNPQPSPDNL